MMVYVTISNWEKYSKLSFLCCLLVKKKNENDNLKSIHIYAINYCSQMEMCYKGLYTLTFNHKMIYKIYFRIF